MKVVFLTFVACACAFAGPDEDWAKIIALDSGPRELSQDNQQARATVADFLKIQEASIRSFISEYGTDSRVIDAKLRLAHLLAVRGDMNGDAKSTAMAWQILSELGKTAPAARAADVAFAKASLLMQTMDVADQKAGTRLLGEVEAFSSKFPNDRRVSALWSETARFYEAQPTQKRKLLQKALDTCRDPRREQQIRDDLRRLDLAMAPLDLKLELTDGRTVDLENYRGKPVVLCFFAQWSGPSIRALSKLSEAIRACGAVEVFGISLDKDRQTALDLFYRLKIGWALSVQSAGWQSPLIRSLGVNALPTLWLVDRKGFIHPLRAEWDLENAIRQFLR